MSHGIALVTFCLVFVACYGQEYDYIDISSQVDPVVFTNTGFVKGGTAYSRNGRPFYYFKGIPYAKPPVGDLRFKAPEEAEPWKGVKEAKEHGPICIQWNTLFEKNSLPIGEEDCLFINVYTPRVFNAEFPLIPVMFQIHYGGLFSGNGNSDILGPEYLLDKDVVLVTFNYRLSVLGMLTTGDDIAPGNYGFKDQLLALKWVRDNIGNFGGDRDKVTIFGQSAGGGSVHHHILSPASKGLFHAAISQSGSALNGFDYPLDGNFLYNNIAKKHAEFVGCNSNATKKEVIKCMRKVDAYELVYTLRNFSYSFIEPLIHYFPTIEKKTEANPNPFITQTPHEIIMKREFNNVPWITGFVSNEGILRASVYIRNSEYLNEINANFEELVPKIAALPYSTPPHLYAYAQKRVLDYFFPNKTIDKNNPDDIQSFINYFGDRFFNYGIYQQTLAHALHGHDPIWFYYFNYKGEVTYGDKFALSKENVNFTWGPCHCDELIYLFKSPKYWDVTINGSDLIMVDLMVDLWTNFAIYHDPTPVVTLGDNFDINFKWEKINNISNKPKAVNADLKYLNITGNYDGEISITMDNSFEPERMQLWNEFNLTESFPNVI